MTTTTRHEMTEDEVLMKAVARLNAGMLGAIIAVITGGGLFLATIILVLKGGPDMGQHLGLLGQYFPGYTVSMKGAFIGLVWAAILGFVIGYTIGRIYNKIASIRNP